LPRENKQRRTRTAGIFGTDLLLDPIDEFNDESEFLLENEFISYFKITESKNSNLN